MPLKRQNIFKKAKNYTQHLMRVRRNPATVTVEERERRLSICRDCPLLIKDLMECSACGCPVEDKTVYEEEQCEDPQGPRWHKA